MYETLLFYLHSSLLLIFGVFTCTAFAGIRLNMRNFLWNVGLCILCGGLQLAIYLGFSETTVRKLYPLIAHLPCVLLLCLRYRKNVITAMTSVFVAYLCCQPAKWFGILAEALWGSRITSFLAQILCLVAVGIVCLIFLAPYLFRIFTKDKHSVYIIGILPAVYYLFDYITTVYTTSWLDNNRIAAEFLPVFFCIAFWVFCLVYYQEYTKTADAKRSEQIIRITVEQQTKEIEAVRKSEKALRLLRHDMRHFLGSLALCIEEGDREKALEMVSAYTSHIEGVSVNCFCGCETMNYVLSAFSAKCSAQNIDFLYDVELDTLDRDETLFCSILNNALENAYHAQLPLPEGKRYVRLLLKAMDSKILLAVKNPVAQIPTFLDGLPVSDRPGHGYGTQSIRYMTERLGGSCQFSMQDDLFVLRVIL